ncbi:protein efr3 [Diplodia corticola]|uniref:Protein efr3 n=1 Tax=Diplodia corticola TaxID=236234 RepID=A0A1J9RWB5_9PEZI|nr:protein efr3 [Diplodia corticola]OJD32132.1 protein efr3 [Diplodia corticola]
MNSLRQSCRPKHQVLILKCYPRLQKGYREEEVKPNSSELSYLLFYASSRRTKLVKVGDFLDKRTAGDVWRSRIASVLVTLQILQALIEKCPKDIPLYANSVLSVLRTVLRSNDVTMVEASVPMFEAFCEHQDPAALAADNEYLTQYEEIVQLYAQFSNKEDQQPAQAGVPLSWPVAIRFRKAGLRAVKAVAGSESLSAGKQLDVIVPVILVNLYAENGAYLTRLEIRDKEKEHHDKETAYARRKSTSTVPGENEGDALAASGTTEDADKIAEEEAGIIALQALRNIFTIVSRDQLRRATLAALKFITSKTKSSEHFPNGVVDGSWPAELCGMMCSWAPVQDRYVILVTASSSLVRSNAVESDFERQYILASLVAWLLGDLRINFIGLSVMDVLVGLMGHILTLLQVGGPASLMNGMDAKASKDSIAAPQESTADASERATTPSEARQKLVQQLKKCVSNLATHIYYTDQIPDMLTAVLSRLKPAGAPNNSMASNTAAAIEDPRGTVESVASSAHLHENPGADNFFSFETARVIALEAIKDILHIANAHGKDVARGKGHVGRSRTGVDTWEGTQWLLRDPGPKVRRAYADALLVWLELELKKTDLRAVPEAYSSGKGEKKERKEGDSLVRRAVSNATSPGSPRDKSPRRFRTSFLQLLHLAVYENAHQFASANGLEADQEILILHLLLTRLVAKLGVNALCTGLPMVFRLQEDIPTIEGAAAKVRLGSLVHGYFWALSTSFNFAASHSGMVIGNEINRRKEAGMWLEGVSVPPAEFKDIESVAGLKGLPAEVVDHQALKPFDNRQDLVDHIAEGYTDNVYSPPNSAPGSPNRSFSVSLSIPNISGGGFMDDHRDSQLPKSNVLPQKVRDQMLESWNKEEVLAAMASNQDASSQSGSLSISHRTKRAHTYSSVATAGGDARASNGYLGVTIPTGHVSPMPSPSMMNHYHRSALSGLNDGNRGGPNSSSSARSAIRLDDLKRVLSEKGENPLPMTRRGRSAEGDDDDAGDSDSMVSADFSTSEYSYAAPGSSYSHGTTEEGGGNSNQTRPPLSTIPSSSMGLDDVAADPYAPPVPHIPAAFAGEGTPAMTTTPPPPQSSADASAAAADAAGQQRPRTATQGSRNNSLAAGAGTTANGTARASRSVKSRAGQSTKSGRGRSRSRSVVTTGGGGRRMDVGGLLAGIGVDGDDDDDDILGRGGAAGHGGNGGGLLGVVNAPY